MSENKIEIKRAKNSHYIEKDKKRTYLTKNGVPTNFLKKNSNYINEIKKIDSNINLTNIKIIEKPEDIYNGIIKSPKHDDFYLKMPNGKVYLYKNNKFTTKMNNWKDKKEKEDYIDAIENYLGKKTKVSFSVYVFAKEDKNQDPSIYYEAHKTKDFKYRVIRKYNVTGYLSDTKKNQLITEFKANKSSLKDSRKIEDYKWLLDMLRNTKTFDHMNAIESLIEYIKVTDLQTMEPDEDFDLKTTPLKNQEKFIEPKINHEFIEYSAKTIKDLQNYKLNEYLLNNFQSESCVYTTLIKLYQTHFDLTYQSLFNYFHQEDLNQVGVTCDAVGKFIYNQKCVFQGGNYAHYFKKLGKKKQEEIKKIIDEKTQLDITKLDFSLSVEQLKKFFIEHNLKMTILDIHGNIIDKHHPTAERSNLSTRHFKGLVSNNHLYQITNRLETIDGEISNSIEELAQTIKTSDKYYMRKNKFIEEFLTNVEELLSYPFEENKFYKFFSVVKLDDVLHWFKEKIKYHPHVTMVDQITKITIKINKSIAIFVPFNAGLSDEVAEIGKTSIEYMKLFVKQGKEFEDALINYKYISTYEESLVTNLLKLPINAPIGLFTNVKSQISQEKIFKLDMTKAYSSVLYNSKFIPAATPFDGFKEYNFEPIVDHHIYIISLDNHDALFSNQKNRIIFGVNLKKIKNLFTNFTEFTITHVCALNKFIPNNEIPKAIDKVKDSGLETADWKFILNKTIGLTGKKYNQGKLSYLFDNLDEANTLSESSECFPKEIIIKNENSELIKKYYYSEIQGEKLQLENGFYLIQALIYDTIRTDLTVLANKLEELDCEIIGVRTDCLYFRGDESNISNKFNFGDNFGDLKPIEEVTINQLPTNSEFQCKSQISVPSTKQKTIKQNLKMEDEFNLDSFDVLNKGNVLVRANLPGAGKTTNIILWSLKNNKKILAVAPTNALAADIKRKFKENSNVHSITFCSLLGLIRGKDVDESSKSEISRDVSDFDIVLFDEIYNLSTNDLYRLKKFKNGFPSKLFIAAGDKYQNKPIEDHIDNPEIYNEIIEDLFCNRVQLNRSRRLKNENEEKILLKLKEDIFESEIFNPLEIVKKYNFSKSQILQDSDNEQKEIMNICYYQGLCDKLAKIYQDTKEIYVKERFLIKKQVFQTNFTYKLEFVNGSAKSEILRICDVLTNKSYEIDAKYLKNFRSTAAYTGHSIQGTTTDKKIIIHNLDSKYITREWLWVAITRATDLNNVYIASKSEISRKKDSEIPPISHHEVYDMQEGFENDITEEFIEKMYEDQNGICKICLNPIIKPSVDRINNNYGHTKNNVQLTCLRCNVTRK